VPLADTTIYEMERRGEFPRRFHLTSRCVAWDRGEVEVGCVSAGAHPAMGYYVWRPCPTFAVESNSAERFGDASGKDSDRRIEKTLSNLTPFADGP
jgi:hypothetical protein